MPIYFTRIGDGSNFLHSEECEEYDEGHMVKIPNYVRVHGKPTFKEAEVVLLIALRSTSCCVDNKGRVTVDLEDEHYFKY